MERADERRLELWRGTATEHELHAGYTLAAALTAEVGDLEASIVTVWPSEGEDEVRSGVRDLLMRPFVQRMASGYRIEPRMAKTVLSAFKDEDAKGFEGVYSALVGLELSALGTEADEDLRWFAAGRVAYYLAPLDPDQSVARFMSAFQGAPMSTANVARQWLTGLVLSQERFLASQGRALTFFRAFRDYQHGRRVEASTAFGSLLTSSERDSFAAISMHLWAILRPGHRLSLERLKASIPLSEELGLLENAIMARNSLAAREFAEAASGSLDKRTEAAQGAARLTSANLQAAVRVGDDYLIRFTDVTDVVARKILLSLDAERNGADESAGVREVWPLREEDVRSLAERLRFDAGAFSRSGDIDGHVYAINVLAYLLRDAGDVAGALAEIEAVVRRFRVLEPTRAVTNLAKTAGSLRRLARRGDESDRANAVLREINEWLGTA